MTDQPMKLRDQVRDRIRVKHFSIRTEQAYWGWIKRFIFFNDKRHPKDMGAPELEAFLTHLAVVGKVSAATQTQALSALLFLYREVLKIELPWLDNVTRAKKSQRLPTVLTALEVKSLLARLDGTRWLMASLLYGTGTRLMECLRLRVKDVDFARREIMIRDGKGMKDRVTMLPESVIETLQAHLGKVKLVHEADLLAGFGEVWLPFALDRKYRLCSR